MAEEAAETGRTYIKGRERQELMALRKISMRERILNAFGRKHKETTQIRHTKTQAVVDATTVGLATLEIARALSGTPSVPRVEGADIQHEAIYQTADQRKESNEEIIAEATVENGDSPPAHRIQRVLDGNLIIEFPSDDPKFVFLKDPYVGETPNDYNGIPGSRLRTVNGVNFNSAENRITLEKPLLEMDKLTGDLYAIVLVEADGLDKPEVADVPIGSLGTSVAYFSGPNEILTVRDVSNEGITAEQGGAIRSFNLEDFNKTTVEPISLVSTNK